VAAQALIDARLSVGLIADLVHVAPAVCRLAFAAAPGRIALVSDAVAPVGLAPGDHVLGGRTVHLPPDGPPRLPDGVLFGSALRLDEAIGNVAGIGVDLATAIDAATRVPADAIGRPDLGRIAEGAAADLVWLGDDLRAVTTWVAGVQV
jgi:N-acetylglucosamine-6-phosphate deacetylase